MTPDELKERFQQQVNSYLSGLLRYISLAGMSTTRTDKGDKPDGPIHRPDDSEQPT